MKLPKKIVLLLIAIVSIISYSFQSVGSDKDSNRIQIFIEGKPFIASLFEGETSNQLIKLLPFQTSAAIYHDNHYYAITPKPLLIKGLKPTHDAVKGGIYYSAEYSGLGIFFADGHFSENELYYIGQIDDTKALNGKKDPVKIKIDKLAE